MICLAADRQYQGLGKYSRVNAGVKTLSKLWLVFFFFSLLTYFR